MDAGLLLRGALRRQAHKFGHTDGRDHRGEEGAGEDCDEGEADFGDETVAQEVLSQGD